MAFFIIGTYFISSKKDKKNLTILFSTITFFLLLVIFRHFGQTIFIMPTRIHMYLMLFMGLIGGYGLSRLKHIKPLYIVLFLVSEHCEMFAHSCYSTSMMCACVNSECQCVTSAKKFRYKNFQILGQKCYF